MVRNFANPTIAEWEALARREKEAGEQRSELERLRKQAAAASAVPAASVGGAPVIELIEPELVATRDIAVGPKKAVRRLGVSTSASQYSSDSFVIATCCADAKVRRS